MHKEIEYTPVAGLSGADAINNPTGDARLVELKSGKPGPSLFLVPGTGGRIEGFGDLARLLQTSMRVFAIEARGLAPSTKPDTNVEEMVTHYLGRIKTMQPKGPYFLLGHSFGGMVVYEMALRLIAAKERVGCLVLLDSVFAKSQWPLDFYLANLKERLLRHCRRILTISIKDNLLYYFRRVILRVYGLERLPSDMKIGSNNARVLLANDRMMKHWKPRFYPDKLTLFCSSDTKNLERAWRNRARELEMHQALGDHINLIESPYVSSLAGDISICLSKASEPEDVVTWH